MALENITLTDIINTPAITPGLGGWDAIINSFVQDGVGRHRFGLLSRVVGVTGSGSTNLVVVPAGWFAIPIMVILHAASSDPGPFDVYFGNNNSSSGTDYDNWYPGGIAGDVQCDLLTAVGVTHNAAVIMPAPLGAALSQAGAANIEPILPICDGDLEDNSGTESSRYFKMTAIGTIGGGGVNVATYGVCWPKDDA